jgi:hypothetical protein
MGQNYFNRQESAEPDSLWGVLYVEEEQEIELILPHLRSLSLFTERQLIVAPRLEPYLSLAANLLAQRWPGQGSLGGWLNVWQDTPAKAILWLDGRESPPTERVCQTLTQARGQMRLLAGPAGAAFYDRCCQGAGLRLWRHGYRDHKIILKVLGASFID